MSDDASAEGRHSKSYGIKLDSNLAAERAVVAVITTSTIDRDREIVQPGGLDTKAYLANPVVLYQHNGWSTPVGKCLWIKRTPDGAGLLAKVQFWKSAEAQDLYDLYASGFMSAFSIGFRTLEGSPPTPEEVRADPSKADCRFIHRKTELLEFSCVTIPCNPDAVVVEKSLRSPTMQALVAEVRSTKASDPDNDGDDDSTPEGDTDGDGGKPIKAGHYVEWGKGRSGGCGKVKSIHKAGNVPGVENDCDCSEDSPGAKVRCYKMNDDGKYVATKRHMGHPLKALTRIDHEMDGAIDEPEEAEPKAAPVPVAKAPEPPSLPAHRTLRDVEAEVTRRVFATWRPEAVIADAVRDIYEREAGFV